MWGDEPRLPELSVEAWSAVRLVTRTVGVILMEVTDQLPPPAVATGALFEETLVSLTEQYTPVPPATCSNTAAV